MSLTYKNLQQKVHLRLNKSDGRAVLAVKEAVNNAQRVLARAHDFDELMVQDITNAFTIASQKTYDWEDDWGLTRPKDVYSIRYMDETNSIKLTYVSPRTLDEYNPYPEGSGVLSPKWYTQRGKDFDLIPVPEEVKALYILYSQWPEDLSGDDDTSPYDDNLEDVIVALSTDIANSILEGGAQDWVQRAQALLGTSRHEEVERPDRVWVARPFQPTIVPYGEYWKDPFVKRNP